MQPLVSVKFRQKKIRLTAKTETGKKIQPIYIFIKNCSTGNKSESNFVRKKFDLQQKQKREKL